MKRLFIIRKDLNMSSGKVAAQVGHCAELYWLNKIKRYTQLMLLYTDTDLMNNYVYSDYKKIICEAKNKKHLLKAKAKAESLGLIEDEDFGLVYDKCYTELTPEEEDGTTLTGIWFAPLEDEVMKKISKKYQLYK